MFLIFPFLAPFIRFSRPTSKHLPLPCADFDYLALIHDSIANLGVGRFGKVREDSERFGKVWGGSGRFRKLRGGLGRIIITIIICLFCHMAADVQRSKRMDAFLPHGHECVKNRESRR